MTWERGASRPRVPKMRANARVPGEAGKFCNYLKRENNVRYLKQFLPLDRINGCLIAVCWF